jgi:hypothetical protein
MREFGLISLVICAAALIAANIWYCKRRARMTAAEKRDEDEEWTHDRNVW